MKGFLVTLLVLIVKGVGLLLSLLGDGMVVRLLKAARLTVTNPDAREGLDDVIGAFRSGPPYSTLIRRMLSSSDDEELRDFLWGALFFKPVDIEKS